jgi:hypothetical protein
MLHIKNALLVSLLSLAAAACGKASGAPAGVPCDAKAIEELSKNLDSANHLGVDLSDKKLEKEGNDMAAKLEGKHYGFKGCTFAMQGNDELDFGAKGTDKTLACTMKGGEKGLADFRHSAMKLDQSKMKLDITGVIAQGGMKGFERLQLTECQVSAHE